MGNSSREVSESIVDGDEESRGRFGSWSRYGSGSSAGSVWSPEFGAADTQGEVRARYEMAGGSAAARDVVTLGLPLQVEGSLNVAVGEVKEGTEGVGGS